jgi:hypothetical protein
MSSNRSTNRAALTLSLGGDLHMRNILIKSMVAMASLLNLGLLAADEGDGRAVNAGFPSSKQVADIGPVPPRPHFQVADIGPVPPRPHFQVADIGPVPPRPHFQVSSIEQVLV